MTSVNPVIGLNQIAKVVPVISTTAYSVGDQFGGVLELPNVFKDIYRSVNPTKVGEFTRYQAKCILQSITAVSLDSPTPRFRFFFFNEEPTVTSTDNQAISIPADQANKCIGIADFCGLFYSAGGFRVGSDSNINLMLSQDDNLSNSSLWVVTRIESAATYLSTSSMRFIFNFYLD